MPTWMDAHTCSDVHAHANLSLHMPALAQQSAAPQAVRCSLPAWQATRGSPSLFCFHFPFIPMPSGRPEPLGTVTARSRRRYQDTRIRRQLGPTRDIPLGTCIRVPLRRHKHDSTANLTRQPIALGVTQLDGARYCSQSMATSCYFSDHMLCHGVSGSDSS